ncbi:MAG: DUF3509 domain-containing protein [Pseudomonas sp.]|uniref:DUF3509 domain-containing protein n=1 Tax=Pseudomonas sp. TaxID=306 RepID=UPI00339A0DDE
MDNPLHALTELFQPQYRVNLSLERLDGCLTLRLSDAQGRVSKHLISPAQRQDPEQLQQLITRVQHELSLRQPTPPPSPPRALGRHRTGRVSGLPA